VGRLDAELVNREFDVVLAVRVDERVHAARSGTRALMQGRWESGPLPISVVRLTEIAGGIRSPERREAIRVVPRRRRVKTPLDNTDCNLNAQICRFGAAAGRISTVWLPRIGGYVRAASSSSLRRWLEVWSLRSLMLRGFAPALQLR
jgi:hypothetical protein